MLNSFYPPSYESCRGDPNYSEMMMAQSTGLPSSAVAGTDSSKSAIYMGDGWCTFPDLDNFDSEKLLKAFTLKEKDSADSIWDPSLSYADSCQRTNLSVSALRQLEALFNLSQLLFGLSRAETVNYTFRDLQLRRHPHSFKKSGFKQLNTNGRIDFYAIFEQLVYRIIEEGGLEVTLLMYKNPMLPMVRQKCLDLISNLATVPDVAFKIMRHQSWFLDHLLILVRDGDIVSDKIPALSVLIRLLKIMLTERMISSYMKLVDMQYIDCVVDIFDNPIFTYSAEFLPFFIKFEFITMQSLTVILGDTEFSQFWSDRAKARLLNYCMVVLLKAAGAYQGGAPSTVGHERVEQINHIFYAEQHSNKHSLAHTIMTVTELLRNDENMKLFYRYHRPFKQLIIKLYKKYGAKSQYIRTDPGISYALNHLMRVLYIKNALTSAASASSGISSAAATTNTAITTNAHKQLSSKNLAALNSNESKAPRICSNPECKNEETKYKQFKECMGCNGQTAYCSSKCKKSHLEFHLKTECSQWSNNNNNNNSDVRQQPNNEIYENLKSLTSKANAHQQPSYNRIYSTTSTINYQKNQPKNRRVSENLQPMCENEFASRRSRDPSTGRVEIKPNYQSLTKTKKLSKFASMNENQRRNSLTFGEHPQPTVENEPEINETNNDELKTKTKYFYAKHTSSMKEYKSGVGGALRRISTMDDDSKFKIAKDYHATKLSVMDESNSFNFVRPLKTSTALCLPDLTRSQSLRSRADIEQYHHKIAEPTLMQKQSDSSSSSSSSDSHSNNQPVSKKFKAANGKPRKKEAAADDNFIELHKRRHSATGATLFAHTKTVDADNIATYPINESLFYHGKKDAIQHLNELSTEFVSDFYLLQGRNGNKELLSSEDEDGEEAGANNNSGDSSDLFSSSGDGNNEEDEGDEEVEAERRGVASRGADNLSSEFSIAEDEQDRRSHYKVVKEFEKTIEFVKNASNLKVMTLGGANQHDDTLFLKNSQYRPVQLGFSIVYYDEENENKENNEEGCGNLEAANKEKLVSSDEDDESEESDDDVKDEKNDKVTNELRPVAGRNIKGVNLIINNSIDSHMLTTSYSIRDAAAAAAVRAKELSKKVSYEKMKLKKRGESKTGLLKHDINDSDGYQGDSNAHNPDDAEFVDDEMSLFKNETLLNTNKLSDYRAFKIPLIPAGDLTNQPYNKTQISNEGKYKRQATLIGNDVRVKNHQKKAELKIFSNLANNNDSSIHFNHTEIGKSLVSVPNEMPKNSTPIFTDANLNAKHKHFLNAKLNLTIAPPSLQQQQQQKIDEPKKSLNSPKQTKFFLPQIDDQSKATQFNNDNNNKLLSVRTTTNSFKTSTLKSNSNLLVESNFNDNEMGRKFSQRCLAPTDTLNVSKISALENATSTNSCVVVARAEMPKDFKKSLKDEFKKDKSKCSIQ